MGWEYRAANTPRDTFLLTHLPTNPMWQLRDDPIDINSFMEGGEALFNRIAQNGNGNYNFKEQIESYIQLNKSEKLLLDAQIGIAYNPQNKRIMSEFPYLILGFFGGNPGQRNSILFFVKGFHMY